MLEQICAHIHNYFDKDKQGRFWHWAEGEFAITNGAIDLDFLQAGQYFRIEGSVFNDGIHQYPADDLTDETFEGSIYAMHTPPAFLALAEEIEAWQEKNGAAASSPYQSESFGGYSYQMASGNSGNQRGSGLGPGWQLTFAARLDPWRKIN